MPWIMIIIGMILPTGGAAGQRLHLPGTPCHARPLPAVIGAPSALFLGVVTAGMTVLKFLTE